MPSTSSVSERAHAVRLALGNPQITADVLATLEQMADDPVNKPGLMGWLREMVEADGDGWEIRTGLRTIARTLQPRTYLEIGTRRGWSLAQVLSECPDVDAWLFDMWVGNYASVDNPGPAFVRDEMARVAPEHRGTLTFLNGNSHETLPAFFDALGDPLSDAAEAGVTRPEKFDLITVDGDHTALGTWWDILDVIPHVAVGGALVFDDLLDWSDEVVGGSASTRFPERYPPLRAGHSLREVWENIEEDFANEFVFLRHEGRPPVAPPIAVAIRVAEPGAVAMAAPAPAQGTSKEQAPVEVPASPMLPSPAAVAPALPAARELNLELEAGKFRAALKLTLSRR